MGVSRGSTIVYDADHLYPTRVSNALGHLSLVTVDSRLGVPISRTDPNGVCSTMRYDRFGRAREVRYADGYFERVENEGLFTSKLTVPNGLGGTLVAATVISDALGRETERRTANFHGSTTFARSSYDRRGRLATVSEPYFAGHQIYSTAYTYDRRDRITSITAPDGVAQTLEYIGLETHLEDGKDIESILVERPDGLIGARKEDDPASSAYITTTFSYGPFDLLREVEAADDTIQSLEYDRQGRRVGHVDPSTGTTTYEYNAFGDRVTEVNGAGETTEFDPDPLGRPRTISSPDGQTTFTWDTAANGIGKLAQSTSADGVVKVYTYDDRGRTTRESWTVEGTSYAIDLTYDTIGRLSQLAYPALSTPTDRVKVDYVYAPTEQLKEVCDPTRTTCYWRADQRNAADQVEIERYGNNVYANRTYRPTGHVSSILTTRPGSATLDHLVYGYDNNRNVTLQARSHRDGRLPGGALRATNRREHPQRPLRRGGWPPVAQITRIQATPTTPSTSPEILYLQRDAQGNVTQTTRETGEIAEEFFHDPFGRRPNRDYAPLANLRRDIRRGYTGHDHDDEFGLINMRAGCSTQRPGASSRRIPSSQIPY